MKVIDVISLEDRYFYVQFVMQLYTFDFRMVYQTVLAWTDYLQYLKVTENTLPSIGNKPRE